MTANRRRMMSEFNREKTAIARTEPSAPAKWAYENGFFGELVPDEEPFIYDWGCGKGKDAEWLQDLGYTVAAYDPNHFPCNVPEDFLFGPVDVILCNYVLNIINDPEEREALLQQIADTGVKTIIISVRSDIDRAAQKGEWKRYGDGYVTSHNTFQRNYDLSDIEDMEKFFGPLHVAHKLSGGIVVVFQR
jgi:DNA phosphorothioation-associated putative methyltransferase